MSRLVVRWPGSDEQEPWHEEREDDAEEREYIKEEGGEVVYAGLESESTAQRVAMRFDNLEIARRQREEEA